MGYQHQIDRAEATLVRIAATVERTEGLLAAVLDTLVTRAPAPRIQLPPSYKKYLPSYTEKAPPHQTDPVCGFDLNAISAPLMQAIPLPPARPAGSLHVTGPNGELPDRAGTPGAINADVTEATLKETIGTPGWTARVRPPVSYTNALKVQVMAEYGIVGNPSDFELDHLVPLCCGGNPVSQQNLWAQRRAGINGASTKDLTEVAAQHAILNGHMSLADVQRGFCEDWTKLHAALFSNPAVVRGLMATEPPEEEP